MQSCSPHRRRKNQKQAPAMTPNEVEITSIHLPDKPFCALRHFPFTVFIVSCLQFYGREVSQSLLEITFGGQCLVHGVIIQPDLDNVIQ